jgi:hypothetical protein
MKFKDLPNDDYFVVPDLGTTVPLRMKDSEGKVRRLDERLGFATDHQDNIDPDTEVQRVVITDCI